MNVEVLRQFLRSLVGPLRAADGSAKAVAALECACAGLEPFAGKGLEDFAEFLARAQDYERQGHWPSQAPPIAGRVVDEPAAAEYAARLKAFLAREVAPGEPAPDAVRAELDRLAAKLKPAQVKELAAALGVPAAFRTGKQGLEQIFLALTGQPLARPKGKGKATAPAADMRETAERLRGLAGTPQLQAELAALAARLKLQEVRALAQALGVTSGVKSRDQGMDKVREALAAGAGAAPAGGLVEALKALKARADQPGAAYEQIEAELSPLLEQLDRAEAIAVARQLGVVRSLEGKADALDAIRHKVFEVRRAKELIVY
jgi:hypothetical protein